MSFRQIPHVGVHPLSNREVQYTQSVWLNVLEFLFERAIRVLVMYHVITGDSGPSLGLELRPKPTLTAQ